MGNLHPTHFREGLDSLEAGAKICPPVALDWAWPLQSLLGEGGTHVDVYVDPGPLRNVLTLLSPGHFPHNYPRFWVPHLPDLSL